MRTIPYYKVAVYARPLIHCTIEVQAKNVDEAKDLAYERVSEDSPTFEWSDVDFDDDDIQGPSECEIAQGPYDEPEGEEVSRKHCTKCGQWIRRPVLAADEGELCRGCALGFDPGSELDTEEGD